VRDTVEFFQSHLLDARAAARLSRLTGQSLDAASAFLQRHVGVCFDACHMAVEFEHARSAVETFQKAGIRIGKVQISAGLCADFDGSERDGALLEALADFAEPVYLHQVVESASGELTRWVDLPEAIAARSDGSRESEWRVHFHVPIFHEELPPFTSTRSFLGDLLAQCAQRPIASHLEVETYTWDVLPPDVRGEPVEQAIARELRWVVARLR
jgi:hypothetical protein